MSAPAVGPRRTAVITGASSGVGRAGALRLARAGWNVIALGRDPARSREAAAAIEAAAAGGAVAMIVGDLASLADTARMADAILARADAIHALLNNAGGVRTAMALTDEGNEATFADNHLGHFLLTMRLLPVLRATARRDGPGSARIVNVSSEGHRTCDGFDWDDPQRVRDWVSGRNYSAAKLANMLFTHELARRTAADGIVAHAMHPGEADTNFASHARPEMQAYIDTLDLISPDVGGSTLAWLAASAEAGRSTNGYFFDSRPVTPAAAARDDAMAARLWRESERLVIQAGLAPAA